MLPIAACLGAGGWTIDHRCGGRNKNSGVGVASLGRVFVSGRSEAGVAWASKEEQGGVAGLHAHWRCRAGMYIPAVPDVGLVEQHGAAVVLVEQYESCGEGVGTLV